MLANLQSQAHITYVWNVVLSHLGGNQPHAEAHR